MVEVHVLQGERELTAHNKSLGRFQLTDSIGAARDATVEVSPSTSTPTILKVSAEDKATGHEQSIRIEAGSGPRRGWGDGPGCGVRHAAEDKERRELIDSRNQAEDPRLRDGEGLKDWGEKVDPATRAKVRGRDGEGPRGLGSDPRRRSPRRAGTAQKGFRAELAARCTSRQADPSSRLPASGGPEGRRSIRTTK